MNNYEGSADESNNNTESKVMAFGDLRQADSISVRTERSNYRFSILDPVHRRGMLTGGVLGDQASEAMLMGAISVDDGSYNTTELKTGWRVVFFVTTNNRLNHMITSAVTDIVLIKGAVAGSRAA
jgi:hypothetical protein